MDQLNWQILECLQENARQSFAEIGRKVGLTSPAVAERVKKMEDNGVITEYRAFVSPMEVGYQLKAIVTLSAFMGRLKPFLIKVKEFEEVINCYRVTGNENVIMEVVLKNQLHLEKFIDELLHYGETKTHIVLSDVITNNAVKRSKS
ncbi:AsnC family transcriptional regulator [Leptobacterium flavescens]|uniref:AsnC family transcriptional regulator n=1 Tax=Leptobacterium flavescens TaxID=472055 RepID=A0A6P0UQ20_9FLAO|nr:Lrp/AsnC family transcriptional regulator [Leptobacterium flavescens]NER15431.1 AsnC family transcriptional regulator [Leptobacterium flavescens]